MEWQPIETAPKDGTRVLLIDADDAGTVCWGEWSDWDEVPECRDIGDIGCNGQYDYQPTHWMPLPSPPQ